MESGNIVVSPCQSGFLGSAQSSFWSFFTTVLYYNNPQQPFNVPISWQVDSAQTEAYTSVYGYPRFDYVKGFLIKPKICLEPRADKIKLSNSMGPIVYVDAGFHETPVDITIGEELEHAYVVDKTFGLANIINNDVDSRLGEENEETDVYTPNPQLTGDNAYAKGVKFEKFQQYFENNVMRPIFYRPQKIAYTAGNLPVEFTYQVEITHEIMAKTSNRYGLPNDIYRTFQNVAINAKAHKFQNENMYRDKSKNIMYFNSMTVGPEGTGATFPKTEIVQPYSHKTYYVEACFPFVPRDAIL